MTQPIPASHMEHPLKCRAGMVTGFGLALALPMLDGHPLHRHPWLTPAVIDTERAITEWSSDPVLVWEASL